MKRERKYRVWDGTRMIYFDLGDIDNGGMIGLPTWDNPIALLDREVMDFVGLLDKNKKEVCESDILKTEYEGLVGFVKYVPSQASYFLMREGLQGVQLSWLVEKCYKIEVIGDIYSTPGLITS